jgi:3-hydroxyisobutyrate dehydrogenase
MFGQAGVMGAAMAQHILLAGYSLIVYNRTAAKASALVAKGAVLAQSPGAVAAESDVVFTMVSLPSDVRRVMMGVGNSETGVIDRIKRGCIVVDMTTSEPSLASEMADLGKQSEKFVLDAPVTGGDVGAKNGTLSVMVGGDRGAFAVVKPLIECFAKTVTYCGAAGTGQHCKLGNQITIASTMIGMCEGMVYAHAAGLDLEKYLTAISGGSAGCKSIDMYAPRILKRDMAPGFFVEHFVKDLGIALNSCRELGISLPGLALASQMYNSLVAYGEQRLGTQALIKVLERLNATELSHSEICKKET